MLLGGSVDVIGLLLLLLLVGSGAVTAIRAKSIKKRINER
jgi:hypothetical protein